MKLLLPWNICCRNHGSALLALDGDYRVQPFLHRSWAETPKIRGQGRCIKKKALLAQGETNLFAKMTQGGQDLSTLSPAHRVSGSNGIIFGPDKPHKGSQKPLRHPLFGKWR